MTVMDGKRFEVVSVVERRRQWPPEEKARIMEEALAPGATVASVADRNGVCRSQVYAWLRKARAGQLAGVAVSAASCALFAPVKIEHPTASPCPLPDASSPAEPTSAFLWPSPFLGLMFTSLKTLGFERRFFFSVRFRIPPFRMRSSSCWSAIEPFAACG